MTKLTTMAAARAALLASMLSLFGLASIPADAAEQFYTFKSVLSSADVNWCINVPGADYASGIHLAVAGCNGTPHQIFGYESGGTITAGGYCVDGLFGTPGQPPGAGDPVVLAECNGSNHQIWELVPFKEKPDVFAIANPDGLCVTVEGASIGPGTPLVLAQCAELASQGWITGKTVGAVPEEYYWYAGHRYCWYDEGWHGPGWYWCGENLHPGIGWGGPIGWLWWHHYGHPPHPHPHPHPIMHPGPHPFVHPHPGRRVYHAPHPHFVPHPHGFAHPHGAPHAGRHH